MRSNRASRVVVTLPCVRDRRIDMGHESTLARMDRALQQLAAQRVCERCRQRPSIVARSNHGGVFSAFCRTCSGATPVPARTAFRAPAARQSWPYAPGQDPSVLAKELELDALEAGL
jgi:hypothetical protein